MGALVPGPEPLGLALDALGVQGHLLVGDVGGVVQSHGPEGGGPGGRQQLDPVEGIERLGLLMLREDIALDHPDPVALHPSVALPAVNAESGNFHVLSSYRTLEAGCEG